MRSSSAQRVIRHHEVIPNKRVLKKSGEDKTLQSLHSQPTKLREPWVCCCCCFVLFVFTAQSRTGTPRLPCWRDSFRETERSPLFDDVPPGGRVVQEVPQVVVGHDHPVALLRVLQHEPEGKREPKRERGQPLGITVGATKRCFFL